MGMIWFQTKRIRGLWNTYRPIGSYLCHTSFVGIECSRMLKIKYVERIRSVVGVSDEMIQIN
jgi:hypothetical protein